MAEAPNGLQDGTKQEDGSMTTERKVAIVTGGSQGLGAAIVGAYRREGWRIVIVARSVERASEDDLIAIPGDVGDRATAEAVVRGAVQHFGRVDTLVNNAGIFIAKPFIEYTFEDYRVMLGTNLSGFFHMTQAVLPEMLQNRSGHIVQITTTRVDQPSSTSPSGLASLTKGGLDAVTRALAIEYAKVGIRANAVAPGVIKTRMHAPAKHQALAASHPLGRMGEPEEVAEAVLYLERATFVTGETLHVDGGQHAGR